jgi:hypothetical protein
MFIVSYIDLSDAIFYMRIFFSSAVMNLVLSLVPIYNEFRYLVDPLWRVMGLSQGLCLHRTVPQDVARELETGSAFRAGFEVMVPVLQWLKTAFCTGLSLFFLFY